MREFRGADDVPCGSDEGEVEGYDVGGGEEVGEGNVCSGDGLLEGRGETRAVVVVDFHAW